MKGDQKTFSFAEGAAGKKIGIASAIAARRKVFKLACRLAIEHAYTEGSATMDDVMGELIARGVHPSELGPAAGGVFRNRKVWEFTGRWAKSKRVSNHVRMNRVWRLSATEVNFRRGKGEE